MIFPFETLNLAQREVGLVIAVLIGFGFGFVLERAGFGRATKLAAQFYFSDMTVFKVMFSAIVTAMLGLVIVSGMGFADIGEISRQIVSWTWFWPMLTGGLLLGVGFIVSGYCPGTSVVAASSGNIDAWPPSDTYRHPSKRLDAPRHAVISYREAARRLPRRCIVGPVW